MMKLSKLSVFLLLTIPLFSFLNMELQENHPPVVKLIKPQNNSAFDHNTSVSYQINVSDKEDGESKYDEINVKEVLLEMRYLKNKQGSLPPARPDEPGLAIIRVSNCFNCHNFNSKAMGPSFYDISKRYPANKSNIDTLVNRIQNGSTGIWGKEKMPSHPELSVQEIKSTVLWMLKNGTNPDINYYTGTSGAFRIDRRGNYLLTASYLDHGLKSGTSKHLKGQDIVVINCR